MQIGVYEYLYSYFSMLMWLTEWDTVYVCQIMSLLVI